MEHKISKAFKNAFLLSPARMIVVSFLLLIVVGGFLLSMPISSKSHECTPFLDALFTATSATCVTGLVVFDTFTHWSAFGQVLIISLIQIGGLGIMTIATFFSIAVGKKLGLRTMQIAKESINSTSFADVSQALKMVMFTTLLIELTGAIILCITFIPKYGADGILISIFLAISAFCNAGFDILGREGPFMSLTNYNGDPIVIFTISALIIAGGLGFLVWCDLFDLRKTKKLMFHTKIVLLMSGALVLFGTGVILLLEWNNPRTLGMLPASERFFAAFFQSVSSRTAGFNSIDIGAMGDLTKMIMALMMFIGAAPGSTGGGVKVTTPVVLMMTVLSTIKGHHDTIVRKRRIDKATVYKSLTITFIAIFVIFITTAVASAFSYGRYDGVDAIFESISAFATVGLSVGVTDKADLFTKMALIFTMFIGRVGPVSLAISIAGNAGPKKNEVIPEGKVMVG